MGALWRNLFRKQAVDRALDEEIRSYRQLLEDEKIAAGVDPETARRQAAMAVGGVESVKEQVRDVRRGAFLQGIWTELRQSNRALRRNPAMTGMCVGMLALGIAASTIVFSIFEAALLRPLPFRDSKRLVELHESFSSLGISEAAFSAADFWDLHDNARVFESVAARAGGEANLIDHGPPEKVTAPRVTIGFFRTLGVAPILGRDFAGNEDRTNVVILGNRFWRTHYAGDPNVIGKGLRLFDQDYTVVGVLPAGEPWIDEQIYRPLPHDLNANRASREWDVIARLRAGTSTTALQKPLQSFADALAAANPTDAGLGFSMRPSSEWIATESTQVALRFLLAAVGLLLLIASVNVANLLLARGLARQREIAVRTALGAGRARVVRYVMLESLQLTVAGALVGVTSAALCLRALQNVEIKGVPRLDQVSLDPLVLLFALSITALVAVLCGLAPALQLPELNIANALREGDRQTGASRRQSRMRSGLVTVEVALAFLLLIGTGLAVRSLNALLTRGRGFETTHRLLFSISFPENHYQNGRGKQFVDQMLDRLSANPDVLSVGAVNVRPVEGPNYGMTIAAAASRRNSTGALPWAGWRVITPGYLDTVGLPLLRGRKFNESDKPVWAEPGQPEPNHRTVILSSALATLLFADSDPIGQHTQLWAGQNGGLNAEVVGVAADSLERGINRPPALTVYLPYGRIGVPSEFILQTRGNPAAVVPAVQSLVKRLDPTLPIADVRSFDQVVSRSMSSQRINSLVLVVFSAIALLLATFGIYGVLSYSVSRRMSEIGLRMALGASESSILRMTIGQGITPALLGIALGLIASAALSRYAQSLLFGIKPLDIPTYIIVSVLMIATAILACVVPGRRAMRIDPAISLRLE